MKIRSLRYLIGEGFKNIWMNRLMSIASVGVLVACMLLMGAAMLVSLNADKALGVLQEQNVVMVYMKDDATNQDAKIAYDSILKIDNVKQAEFISKEDGMDKLMEDMGQDEYGALFNWLDKEESFLPYGVKVSFDDLEKYDETLKNIKNVKNVDHINDSSEVTSYIVSIRQTINIAGIAIISLLVITALVIIANTIRITMNSRKLEISIMKAVGATNSFVRVPFIVEGIVFGVISATITTGALYFIYNFLISQLTGGMFNAVKFEDVVWFMYGGFCILGIFAGVVGSMFSMGKYLKKEGSEFSAL